MTGYGPDLMLRALEEVGLSLVPDVVVFNMYTAAFHRVHPHYAGVGFEIPRFRLESGQLVTVSYPEPRPWDHLRIFQAMNRAYWNFSGAQWALNEAILDRFLKNSTTFYPSRH